MQRTMTIIDVKQKCGDEANWTWTDSELTCKVYYVDRCCRTQRLCQYVYTFVLWPAFHPFYIGNLYHYMFIKSKRSHATISNALCMFNDNNWIRMQRKQNSNVVVNTILPYIKSERRLMTLLDSIPCKTLNRCVFPVSTECSNAVRKLVNTCERREYVIIKQLKTSLSNLFDIAVYFARQKVENLSSDICSSHEQWKMNSSNFLEFCVCLSQTIFVNFSHLDKGFDKMRLKIWISKRVLIITNSSCCRLFHSRFD